MPLALATGAQQLETQPRTHEQCQPWPDVASVSTCANPLVVQITMLSPGLPGAAWLALVDNAVGTTNASVTMSITAACRALACLTVPKNVGCLSDCRN